MIGLGRLYTVSFDNQSYTTANADHDYFTFTPADDKIVVLEAVYIYTTSEVGDAQEEQVRWSIVRGHATVTGGTSATIVPVLSTDTAAGFTSTHTNSTISSAGSGATVHAGSFNIRVGLEYVPPPEHRIIATQAHTTLVVRQLSTLADDATMSGTAYLRELG